MKVITGSQPAAWKIVIYGPPGIGKSSLSAFAPRPFFLDLEKGLDQIAKELAKKNVSVVRSDHLTEWETGKDDSPGVVEALKWFCAHKEDYDTLVVDTISALEGMLTKVAIDEFNDNAPSGKEVSTLAKIPYGQGYDILAAQWSLAMKYFTKIQTEYGKNIVLVGHQAITRVDDPTTESYDRYVIDTHKKCLPLIVNNCDAVLFARQEVIVKEKEHSDKTRAVSTGERLLYCMDQPSYLAKNRFGLQEKIKMSPELFKELAK